MSTIPVTEGPVDPAARPVEPPAGITDPRLARQIAFLLEIDQLKSVLRQSHLIDLSRRENDAEHSWHLAMLAVVLGEYAAVEVNQGHVIRMLLIHDLVEVYAGDTFLYDTQAAAGQAEREHAAADRLFPQLPGARRTSCGRCGTSSRPGAPPTPGSPARSTGSSRCC